MCIPVIQHSSLGEWRAVTKTATHKREGPAAVEVSAVEWEGDKKDGQLAAYKGRLDRHQTVLKL